MARRSNGWSRLPTSTISVGRRRQADVVATPPPSAVTVTSPVPLNAAFVVASFSLVLIFATAGTPIPLYNTYRAVNGITNGDLAFVSAGYFVAAAAALLVLGRLSNHLGRKPVALAALVTAAISC